MCDWFSDFLGLKYAVISYQLLIYKTTQCELLLNCFISSICFLIFQVEKMIFSHIAFKFFQDIQLLSTVKILIKLWLWQKSQIKNLGFTHRKNILFLYPQRIVRKTILTRFICCHILLIVKHRPLFNLSQLYR